MTPVPDEFPARRRFTMDVMEVARAIGLVGPNGEAAGTIDQSTVLSALTELTQDDPAHADLFDAVAARVRRARSAGVEEHQASSFQVRPGADATIQLRYRSEMAELFTDLAIDVGLRRHHQKLVPAA